MPTLSLDPEAGNLFLIDKPKIWTSFNVVSKVRYALRARLDKKHKVGHAGTLDPLATGLLLLATGPMTKSIPHLQGLDKEYTGIFRLGQTTPSYDLETAVDTESPYEHLQDTAILETARAFVGTQMQMPPIFSAVKLDGKRLYKHARAGKEAKDLDIAARPIEIFAFELGKIELPFVHFRVHCSKGTYIRSLAHDFGQALGVGAYLLDLRRTRIGMHTLEEAWALPELIAQIQQKEEK
ncbi:MAG: tRNA pseudouridine(55) synthase TruB [Microscillaceae bacterium]